MIFAQGRINDLRGSTWKYIHTHFDTQRWSYLTCFSLRMGCRCNAAFALSKKIRNYSSSLPENVYKNDVTLESLEHVRQILIKLPDRKDIYTVIGQTQTSLLCSEKGELVKIVDYSPALRDTMTTNDYFSIFLCSVPILFEKNVHWQCSKITQELKTKSSYCPHLVKQIVLCK